MAEATNPSLRLAHTYRGVTLDARSRRNARQALSEARDALHFALLTLDEPTDRSTHAAWERIAKARGFLAEAVHALSKARVHVPGVRTLALPALMATLPNAADETLRLHQIATKLLWNNHAHLPYRAEAKPLTDEDEAQLARVLRILDGQRKVSRVLRHKWIAGAALAAGLSPLLGLPAGLVAVACGLLEANEIRKAAQPSLTA
jgi:hypothetical protein